MNQSRARVVGVATLLFLAIIAHRLLYYGARGDLVLAWLDGPAEGGAGISRQEALVLYERVGILTGWAPLVGGLLALGLRRLALPIGALFFVAAGSSFALGSPTSPVGLGVFALGHGLLLTAIYASAGVEPVGSRQARIGLFLLLSAGLNAGAVMGPSMATSISGVAGHRVWFGVFALASLGLVALGGVMTVVGRSAPGQTDTRVRERLLPIGVASLLVALRSPVGMGLLGSSDFGPHRGTPASHRVGPAEPPHGRTSRGTSLSPRISTRSGATTASGKIATFQLPRAAVEG